MSAVIQRLASNLGITSNYLKFKREDDVFCLVLNESVPGCELYTKIFFSKGANGTPVRNVSNTTKREYDMFGDYYVFNGEKALLKTRLRNFDIGSGDISLLIDELMVEFGIYQYIDAPTRVASWFRGFGAVVRAVITCAELFVVSIDIFKWWRGEN